MPSRGLAKIAQRNASALRSPLFRRLALLSLLLGCMLPAAQPEARSASGGLPTLVTSSTIHQLTPEQASQHYPIRLQAVVTYYDTFLDPRNPVLFVCDPSGCIYVALSARFDLTPGQAVEIDGVSSPGEFAPVLTAKAVHVLGPSHLPTNAARVNSNDLLSGDRDCQWVEVEGIVQSVTESGGNVFLHLSLRDGTLSALTVKRSGIDYSSLVDTRIRLRGNVGAIFNRRGQLTGAHIMFPGPAAIKMLEPGSLDAFSDPPRPIDTLLRYSPHAGLQHRVHIQGTVTLLWPSRKLCVQNGLQGICAQTPQATFLNPGDLADVVGFPRINAFTPLLDEAEYRSAGPGRQSVPISITAADALTGDHDAQLVSIEGQLIGRDQAAEDPTLVLTAGNYVFTAQLPDQLTARALPAMEPGTWLKIVGVCAVETDREATAVSSHTSIAKSFRILMRSPADVVVAQTPSWWNAEHTLRVLAVALLVAMVALGTAIALSLRVRRQKEVIAVQLAETAVLKDAAEAAHEAAHYLAAHDGLTGVLNRRAISDALRREFELGARTQSRLSILMLDLDHFKRVNDTCGHPAGDEVLKESVRRIQAVLRSTDLLGRYGGEEFLIVLPNCDQDQLHGCAERVRLAISCHPIFAEGVQLSMTVSAGATVACVPPHTEQDALRAADRALYLAKHSGRNRVVYMDLEDSTTSDVLMPNLNPGRHLN